MKLKSDLVLRQVADIWVVLAMTRDTLNFDGMLKLNESGAMLWRVLQETGDRNALVNELIREYSVEAEVAQKDVDAFLETLKSAGCIEE